MDPKYLTIHCSATQPDAKVNAAVIRDWHVNGNGWSDIGYHYVINRDGSIEEGRPVTRQGAHTYGHNKDNIGVCLVGGVDSDLNPEDNFTDVQWVALRYMISYLAGLYGIKEENIKGRRDWAEDNLFRRNVFSVTSEDWNTLYTTGMYPIINGLGSNRASAPTVGNAYNLINNVLSVPFTRGYENAEAV